MSLMAAIYDGDDPDDEITVRRGDARDLDLERDRYRAQLEKLDAFGLAALKAEARAVAELEAEVADLKNQRDYLLGRLVDLKLDRMTRSTEGEFTHADTVFWADRARRKHLFAASQDDEYGSDVGEPNGYYRELARGEQP